MRRLDRVKTLSVCTLAVAGLMLLIVTNSADARPQYKKAFEAKYPDVVATSGTGQPKKLTCAVCHPIKSKKKRNNYGEAVRVALEEAVVAALGPAAKKKNVRDANLIKAAFQGAENMDSAQKDKTFGDLVKHGHLPGTDDVANPAPVDDAAN